MDAFYNEVLGTTMGIRFAVAKLRDFADAEELLRAARNPFALVTLAHLRARQARHDPQQLCAAKWQLTRLLYQHGWSKRRIITLFRVINWMMVLPARQQERYWRNVIRWEKERKMEWITPLEESFMEKGWRKGQQEGLTQGREQGPEQGRQQGAARLLERQLVLRFGPLSVAVQRKLARAGEEQLRTWGEALLEAHSLKQVFA